MTDGAGGKEPGVEEREGVQRAFGSQMDVAPARVPLADLDHRDVEGAKALRGLAEVLDEAGVAAEEDPVSGADDRPGGPVRSHSPEQAAAGEVAARRRYQVDISR